MNLDTLLPQIQKLVSDKMINALKKEGPKSIAKGIYTMLPGAIRILIKEDTFVSFCLTHQDKIFGKTPVAKKPIKKSATKKAIPTKKITIKTKSKK
jgi:hypothetical protein